MQILRRQRHKTGVSLTERIHKTTVITQKQVFNHHPAALDSLGLANYSLLCIYYRTMENSVKRATLPELQQFH